MTSAVTSIDVFYSRRPSLLCILKNGNQNPEMLPLALLNAAQQTPIQVELKNGETFNGVLTNCDSWMNLNLSQVIVTSQDGSIFKRLQTIYLRGNNIKYLRVGEQCVDRVVEDNKRKQKIHNSNHNQNQNKQRKKK
jgi:U6 snRNA-associated Sm-like protein LSm4